MNSTTPCRRWSFSLRTLFVVMTVVAALFGWKLHRVHQRLVTATEIRNRGGSVQFYPFATLSDDTVPRGHADLFGDAPVKEIWLPTAHFGVDDVDRIRATYPEAHVAIIATEQTREDSPATQAEQP